MTTSTIAEIGGLMIIAAVTLQLLMGLRSMRARASERGRHGSAIAEFSVEPAGRPETAITSNSVETVLWMGKRKFRIARRMYENESQDICSYYLVPLDERALPGFRPGQFLTFELPVHEQEHPAMRCYSLSESPTEDEYYRISVKRLPAPANAPENTPPGLSSGFFHDVALEGDIVETFAPTGEFCLDQSSDRPVVLIAGGVGLTPLLSMLNWLIDTRSEREIWLFYGVGNRSDHMMYDHLKLVRKECPNVNMYISYSQPTPNCRPRVDYNVHGHITVDLIQSLLDGDQYEFYLCGPSAMMNSIRSGLTEWGVPADDIRSEAFQAPSKQARMAGETIEPGNEPEAFEVKFSRSGRILRWNKGVDTLLELAESNGIKMPCSCRSGNCGTCLTKLTQGTVDYVHPPSREHDDGSCLPCIARPNSDLVLDL